MQICLRQSQDLDELVRRISHERNAKQRDRYRAVWWALRGNSSFWIADKLDRGRASVQRWVYAYRDGGLDAIIVKPRPGRPTKLTKDQTQAFTDRLEAGPTAADGGRCTLRGKDVVRILDQEFGVSYSLQGAYDLLHRLGYCCLTPRPRHRKNDPQAMARWLHQTPL